MIDANTISWGDIMVDNVFSETIKAIRSSERSEINEDLRRWMIGDTGHIVEYNDGCTLEQANISKPLSKEELEQKELIEFLDSLICIIDRLSYNDNGPATNDYNKVRKYIIKMERDIKNRGIKENEPTIKPDELETEYVSW